MMETKEISELSRSNRIAMLSHISTVMVMVFFMIWEIVRGQLSPVYMIIATVVGVIPLIGEVICWNGNTEHAMIKHLVSYGFALFYTICLFTSPTNMIYVFVIPMVFVVTIYSDTRYLLLINTGTILESFIGIKPDRLNTTITGLEMFRKSLEFAQAGDNIGALLRGVDKKSIERGQVLCKPGSIHPHTKFVGQVYVLSKEEGGRHTPFFNNYRPQFYFRTTDVTGIITLPEGTEMCMPGDNVDMHVELITPVAMEEGLRFAIREGGHTVGSGVVSKIDK